LDPVETLMRIFPLAGGIDAVAQQVGNELPNFASHRRDCRIGSNFTSDF
jgi:hypothetical protein